MASLPTLAHESIRKDRPLQKAVQEAARYGPKEGQAPVEHLAADIRHPSLYAKRIRGREGIWEARVDVHHGTEV
jgi:hypothetical protein